MMIRKVEMGGLQVGYPSGKVLLLALFGIKGGDVTERDAFVLKFKD